MGTNLISDVETPTFGSAATRDNCELWQRPAWLSETIWPFPTSAIRVNCANVVVASVGGGPVLLFVHAGLSSIIWRNVISNAGR
jgi:hypothetical protein